MKVLKKEVKEELFLFQRFYKNIAINENDVYVDLLVIDHLHRITKYKYDKKFKRVIYVGGDDVYVGDIPKVNEIIKKYLIRKEIK